MKKVKIIFDNNTSIVGDNQPIANIFSNSISKLQEFIAQNKLEERAFICLTDIFKKEGIAELQNKAISRNEDLKRIISVLKNISTIDSEKNNEDDLRSKVENQFNEKIMGRNIQIIPTPNEIIISDLINRSVYYKPPFERGDKGFKDTIAWISILEDAKNNKDFEYVIVTIDHIFFNKSLKEEFLQIHGKNIHITNADPIEGLLDEVLELGIGLEKIKEEITKDLDLNTPFQHALERKALEILIKENDPLLSFMPISFFNTQWKSEVVNLLYKSAVVNVKNNINKDLFEVEINVCFTPKYASLNKPSTEKTSPSTGTTMFDFSNKNLITFSNPYIKDNYYPRILTQKFLVSYQNKNFSILNAQEIKAEFSSIIDFI